MKKSGKQTLVQQLQDDIQKHKNDIEYLQNDYKKKFDELGRILEISEGLDKLVYRPNDHRKN